MNTNFVDTSLFLQNTNFVDTSLFYRIPILWIPACFIEYQFCGYQHFIDTNFVDTSLFLQNTNFVDINLFYRIPILWILTCFIECQFCGYQPVFIEYQFCGYQPVLLIPILFVLGGVMIVDIDMNNTFVLLEVVLDLADFVYPVQTLWFCWRLCWTQLILSILFRPFGFLAPNDFKIILASYVLVLSIPSLMLFLKSDIYVLYLLCMTN